MHAAASRVIAAAAVVDVFWRNAVLFGFTLPPVPARMTPDPATPSLLDEIDARQNELLGELDQLNARIEHVLQDCLIWRGADEQALPAAA